MPTNKDLEIRGSALALHSKEERERREIKDAEKRASEAAHKAYLREQRKTLAEQPTVDPDARNKRDILFRTRRLADRADEYDLTGFAEMLRETADLAQMNWDAEPIEGDN